MVTGPDNATDDQLLVLRSVGCVQVAGCVCVGLYNKECHALTIYPAQFISLAQLPENQHIQSYTINIWARHGKSKFSKFSHAI